MTANVPFRPALDAVLAQHADSLAFEEEVPALVEHFDRVAQETEHLGSPFDRAFVAGFLSDRIGTAFGCGYLEALVALAPLGAARPRAALAVTESGGGHPRAIATKLVQAAEDTYRIDGEKTVVTLAGAVEVLLVAVSEGTDDEGRNRIRLARVPVEAPGVTLHRGPMLPFAPEIPHAKASLHGVRVHERDLLPGDGYARYVKPFRTVEDIHVHGAMLGHVLRVARRFDFPREGVAELLSLAVSLRALASESALAPSTHLALAGAIDGFERVLAGLAPAWERVEPGVRARFERDAPLRKVASKARAQRFETAWSLVGHAAIRS